MNDSVRQHLLDRELSSHAYSFLKTGNAIFLWKAFQLCRRWGVPVREDILAMFDQIAAALMRAESPAEQLDALMLSTRKDGGGRAAALAARTHERRRLIAEKVVALKALGKLGFWTGFDQTAAIEKVANDLGMKPGDVKKVYFDLRKTRPPRRRPRVAALDSLPRKVHRLL